MDQIRNFTQANRSSIVNIIYIVAAVVLVYYLVMYYFDTEIKDKDLLSTKLAAANIKKDKNNTNYEIVAKDGTTCRILGEYTLSFWIYINSTTSGSYNGILTLLDAGNQKESGTGASKETIQTASLTVALHPTMPKMIIREGALTGNSTPESNFVKFKGADAKTLEWQGATVSEDDAANTMTPCDVTDIDMQRWMNVAIAVNGRIMDVYLDGKLARSCIMDKTQKFSDKALQQVVLMPGGAAFSGYLSGIRVSNYAVTPDMIYGRYQAGPSFGTSFLDYLLDKLNIDITYTGADGEFYTGGLFGFIKRT